MAVDLLRRLDKPFGIFAKITNQLDAKELAVGMRPFSVAIGCMDGIRETHGKSIGGSASLTDGDDITNTEINSYPLVITFSGTCFRAASEQEVGLQTAVDLIDLRPPLSAIKGPYFQMQLLRKWNSTNQLLTVTATRQYKDLVINNLEINETPKTGNGAYDVVLTMTRAVSTLKKDLEKTKPPNDGFIYKKETQREENIGTTTVN